MATLGHPGVPHVPPDAASSRRLLAQPRVRVPPALHHTLAGGGDGHCPPVRLQGPGLRPGQGVPTVTVQRGAGEVSGVWGVRVGRGGGSECPIPSFPTPSHTIPSRSILSSLVPSHPIPSLVTPRDSVLPAEAQAMFSSQHYVFSYGFSLFFTLFSHSLYPQPSLNPFQSL